MRLPKYPSRAHLSDQKMRDIEDSLLNNDEAHELLDLINAEFTSDPMSVQCFDLHIVERVRLCVEKHKLHVARQLI